MHTLHTHTCVCGMCFVWDALFHTEKLRCTHLSAYLHIVDCGADEQLVGWANITDCYQLGRKMALIEGV